MGTVYLVGAGPGDPELLTVKAVRLLRSADVVLHDALVAEPILDLIRPGAKVIDAGKRCGRPRLTQDEINALLVHHAARVRAVVRLKGGDPSVFGRSGEEIEALERAGVLFEIVPGITSALAAAAAARISLTDRRDASSVVFTTPHRAAGSAGPDWDTLVASGATLAIYMPGQDYGPLAAQLVAAGLPHTTPCTIVSSASRASQQVRQTDLDAIACDRALPAPALLIVGRCARSRTNLMACARTPSDNAATTGTNALWARECDESRTARPT